MPKSKNDCTPCPKEAEIAKLQELEHIYGTTLHSHTETKIVNGKRIQSN